MEILEEEILTFTGYLQKIVKVHRKRSYVIEIHLLDDAGKKACFSNFESVFESITRAANIDIGKLKKNDILTVKYCQLKGPISKFNKRRVYYQNFLDIRLGPPEDIFNTMETRFEEKIKKDNTAISPELRKILDCQADIDDHINEF